jgi:hypothetical protein
MRFGRKSISPASGVTTNGLGPSTFGFNGDTLGLSAFGFG